MRSRRDLRNPNTSVFHVTNRIFQGLPLIPIKFVQEIILGIMGRYQEKHPVRITHFIWMQNHFHIIFAGEARHIAGFMAEMQREIARAVKKWFPEYEGKVWSARYKAQKLATVTDVIRMICYLYLNPVRAHLVRRISDWEGCSSYKLYRSGTKSIEVKWTPSRYLWRLKRKIGKRYDIHMIRMLKGLPQAKHHLRIEPSAWKGCFEESKDWSDEYIYKLIEEELRTQEAAYNEEYRREFAGMKKIKSKLIDLFYRPEKKTPSPFLICHDVSLRKRLIVEYKFFCQKCREAWRKWKMGLINAPYVYGAYRPGLPILGWLRAES